MSTDAYRQKVEAQLWSNLTKELDDKVEGFASAVKGFFSSSD